MRHSSSESGPSRSGRRAEAAQAGQVLRLFQLAPVTVSGQLGLLALGDLGALGQKAQYFTGLAGQGRGCSGPPRPRTRPGARTASRTGPLAAPVKSWCSTAWLRATSSSLVREVKRAGQSAGRRPSKWAKAVLTRRKRPEVSVRAMPQAAISNTSMSPGPADRATIAENVATSGTTHLRRSNHPRYPRYRLATPRLRAKAQARTETLPLRLQPSRQVQATKTMMAPEMARTLRSITTPSTHDLTIRGEGGQSSSLCQREDQTAGIWARRVIRGLGPGKQEPWAASQFICRNTSSCAGPLRPRPQPVGHRYGLPGPSFAPGARTCPGRQRNCGRSSRCLWGTGRVGHRTYSRSGSPSRAIRTPRRFRLARRSIAGTSATRTVSVSSSTILDASAPRLAMASAT